MTSGIDPLDSQQSHLPVHAGNADAVIPCRTDDPGDVGSVSVVGRVIVHRITTAIEHVITMSTGRASVHASGIGPDVRSEIGMVVIDACVSDGNDNRTRTSRDVPGLPGRLVRSGHPRGSIHTLSAIEQRPLLRERGIVGRGIHGVAEIGFCISNCSRLAQHLNRLLHPAGRNAQHVDSLPNHPKFPRPHTRQNCCLLFRRDSGIETKKNRVSPELRLRSGSSLCTVQQERGRYPEQAELKYVEQWRRIRKCEHAMAAARNATTNWDNYASG